MSTRFASDFDVANIMNKCYNSEHYTALRDMALLYLICFSDCAASDIPKLLTSHVSLESFDNGLRTITLADFKGINGRRRIRHWIILQLRFLNYRIGRSLSSGHPVALIPRYSWSDGEQDIAPLSRQSMRTIIRQYDHRMKPGNLHRWRRNEPIREKVDALSNWLQFNITV